MIRRCSIFKCDVCGKEDMFEHAPGKAPEPDSGVKGWFYVSMGDVDDFFYRDMTQDALLLCPDCSLRIKSMLKQKEAESG